MLYVSINIVIHSNDDRVVYTPTAITAPPIVFPIPDTAPLMILFGFDARNAIKLGIFMVFKPLNISDSSSRVEG